MSSEPSPSIIQVDPEISMGLVNRTGLAKTLTMDDVRRGAGVAILLGGPSKTDPTRIAQSFDDVSEVRIVGGMPFGTVYENLVDWTNRAVLVVMGPYFDRRHAAYLCRQLMNKIADRRGLKGTDEAVAAIVQNDVPAGDLARMDEAVSSILRQLDGLIQYPIVGTTH